MIHLVSAVFQNTGISKQSGQPFTMPRVTVLTNFRDVSTPNFQSHGSGLSSVDLAVDDVVYAGLKNHFDSQFKDMPVSMDLDMTFDSQGRNYVTGFNPAFSVPLTVVESSSDSETEQADRKKTVMFGNK